MPKGRTYPIERAMPPKQKVSGKKVLKVTQGYMRPEGDVDGLYLRKIRVQRNCEDNKGQDGTGMNGPIPPHSYQKSIIRDGD